MAAFLISTQPGFTQVNQMEAVRNNTVQILKIQNPPLVQANHKSEFQLALYDQG